MKSFLSFACLLLVATACGQANSGKDNDDSPNGHGPGHEQGRTLSASEIHSVITRNSWCRTLGHHGGFGGHNVFNDHNGSHGHDNYGGFGGHNGNSFGDHDNDGDDFGNNYERTVFASTGIFYSQQGQGFWSTDLNNRLSFNVNGQMPACYWVTLLNDRNVGPTRLRLSNQNSTIDLIACN